MGYDSRNGGGKRNDSNGTTWQRNDDSADNHNDGNNEDRRSSKKKGDSMSSNNGFKSFGLSDPVYRGIVRMGFRNPTPVQRKSLPVILTGVDTVVMARTGSGKTIAFCIPLIEKLLSTPKKLVSGSHVRGIILSPTRELSQQTLRVFLKLLGPDSGIRCIGIHGAESMEQQFSLLASKPDVIIATPGRLAHHLTEIPDFHLNGCTMCILDEADRLLEMGFATQIRQIAKTLPESCQKVLLSATMPKVLVEFTQKYGFASDPTMIRLDQEVSVSAELRIAFVTCRSLDKDAALLHIMSHIQHDKGMHTTVSTNKKNRQREVLAANRTGLTLIFTATRHHVEYIATLLQASGYEDNVTMIYGTLDQEARKQNLHEFKSGKKSILVVTDVAARGIDVPMIDHVIHYHFPPSSKLFVHRSGRAARAGRIGFCWSLVEPDELPYMIDLHLFLGRRPSTGRQSSSSDDEQLTQGNNDGSNDEYTYTLDEMTPDMVHYGSLPESIACVEVENVQRIMNSELSSSKEAESLRALTKVCKNAMKQYRRTRPEASRDAVRRAKAILEGERLDSGQRVGTGGTIPPHPLLRNAELRLYTAMNQTRGILNGTTASNGSNTNSGELTNLGSLENLREREEFLRAMANFRPKETVFEAFATGKSKDIGVVSQVDKGRTMGIKNKTDSSTAALTAMKNMRRQMRIAHDKGSTLVVAGSASATQIDNDDAKTNNNDNESCNNDEDDDNNSSRDEVDDDGVCLQNSARQALSAATTVPPNDGKRRLSKAERKRMKSNPADDAGDYMTQNHQHDHKQKKLMRGTDFRDNTYFIDNDVTSNTEEAHRSRQIEAAMQPNSGNASRGSFGHALRMEEAMLDIVGDENDELVKRQRMVRWDKSKRKYVQTTVGSELSGDSKSKKLRLESGQIVKTDKLKLGELYEKWQKRTNRSIGRSGVFDDADGDDGVNNSSSSKRKASRDKNGGKGNIDSSEKVKNSFEIKKERAKKQDMKMKNMKKGDRRAMMGSNSEKNDNKHTFHDSKQKTKSNSKAKSGGKSFSRGKGGKFGNKSKR